MKSLKYSKTVAPKKDTMAANVGGSAHLDGGGKVSPSKYVKGSGGKSASKKK